jgi:putative transposase
MAYASDLTEEQWNILCPLLPPESLVGRPNSWSLQIIINAILYITRAGCAWRLLPSDLPLGKPFTITFVNGPNQEPGYR